MTVVLGAMAILMAFLMSLVGGILRIQTTLSGLVNQRLNNPDSFRCFSLPSLWLFF